MSAQILPIKLFKITSLAGLTRGTGIGTEKRALINVFIRMILNLSYTNQSGQTHGTGNGIEKVASTNAFLMLRYLLLRELAGLQTTYGTKVCVTIDARLLLRLN